MRPPAAEWKTARIGSPAKVRICPRVARAASQRGGRLAVHAQVDLRRGVRLDVVVRRAPVGAPVQRVAANRDRLRTQHHVAEALRNFTEQCSRHVVLERQLVHDAQSTGVPAQLHRPVNAPPIYFVRTRCREAGRAAALSAIHDDTRHVVQEQHAYANRRRVRSSHDGRDRPDPKSQEPTRKADESAAATMPQPTGPLSGSRALAPPTHAPGGMARTPCGRKQSARATSRRLVRARRLSSSLPRGSPGLRARSDRDRRSPGRSAAAARAPRRCRAG